MNIPAETESRIIGCLIAKGPEEKCSNDCPDIQNCRDLVRELKKSNALKDFVGHIMALGPFIADPDFYFLNIRKVVAVYRLGFGCSERELRRATRDISRMLRSAHISAVDLSCRGSLYSEVVSRVLADSEATPFTFRDAKVLEVFNCGIAWDAILEEGRAVYSEKGESAYADMVVEESSRYAGVFFDPPLLNRLVRSMLFGIARDAPAENFAQAMQGVFFFGMGAGRMAKKGER